MRDLIVSQTLAPGAHVNESKLSVQLGVSRTPLREALAALEADVLVRYERDRGYFVTALDPDEVREIYPIGRELDLLALRSTRHFSEATLSELKRLNAEFLKARNQPEKARVIDTRFHRTLIGSCNNRRLLQMLDTVQSAMERYERLYMGDRRDVERSAAQHTLIIEALERDDFAAAETILTEHWNGGFNRLLAMLGRAV